MYKTVAKEVLGTRKFVYRDYEIDFDKKWEVYDYETIVKKYTKIDIFKATKNEIEKKLKELDMEFDSKVDKWRLVDILWKYCRKNLVGPGFLVGQPVQVSPLAKRNEKDPRKVNQFQVIIAGSEVGNGYSELNDPLDQEERFKEQMKNKEAGDTESMEHDKGFIEALKYGMPPTCGFGVSERLFWFLINKPARECVIFPLVKPEQTITEKKKSITKKKK
jgi:lysyl-tRNA synthetase class 2